MSTPYHLSEARFRRYAPYLTQALAASGTDIPVPLNGAKPDYLAKSLREAIRSWKRYKWTPVPWTEAAFLAASPVIRIAPDGQVCIHTQPGTKPPPPADDVHQLPAGTPLDVIESSIRLAIASGKPVQILSPHTAGIMDLLTRLQPDLDIHWSHQPNDTLIVL